LSNMKITHTSIPLASPGLISTRYTEKTRAEQLINLAIICVAAVSTERTRGSLYSFDLIQMKVSSDEICYMGW
jgi:ribosomal 30S subunit maturation factor RimM